MLYDNIKNSAMIVENYETTKMEWLFIEPMISEEMYTELLSISGPDRAARLVDIFNDEEIIQLLYQKFANTEVRSDTIKSIYAFHQVHGAGYTLKPHVDSYPRVFTVVMYFAKDNDTPEAGTVVYNIIDIEKKEYETSGIAPFRRNSGMIISPTDSSWHGVDMLTKELERESVVLVFSAEPWNDSQMHYADWKPGVTVDYKKI